MTQSSTTVYFDEWTFHRTSGELEKEGVRVRLQDLPLQILNELLLHPGEMVSREQLIAKLWPKGVIDFETSLNSAVRKLRAALNDDADSPRYIQTVPRRGYRFIGKIVEPTQSAPSPVTDAPAARQPDDKRRGPWLWLAGAMVIAAIAVAVGLAFVASRPPDRIRLAVMPFENLSPNPELAFFADGLHDEVLTALAARTPTVEVISRTTMASYRGQKKTIQEIAGAIGATHVLEGSVRRDDSTVRLALQLIDARRDKQMWSHSFDRAPADVMTLQSDVAEEVAAQLSTRLVSPTSSKPLTSDPEAYDLYLKARQIVINAGTPIAQFNEVESLLTRSLQLDPAFTRAYILRASLHNLYFILNMDTSEARIALGRADIGAARKLSPDDPVIDVQEGVLLGYTELNVEPALRKMEAAALLGDTGALYSKAILLSINGRYAESNAIIERLHTLDPRNQRYLIERVHNLLCEDRFADALRIARNSPIEVPPPVMRSFSFAGSGTPYGPLADSMANVVNVRDLTAIRGDPAFALTFYFNFARLQRNFPVMREVLSSVDFETAHAGSFEGYTVMSIGPRPVAEFRGWIELLLGNKAAAAEHGKAILNFVSRQKAHRWNEWFLHMLEAEAHMFMDDNAAALASVDESLRAPPDGANNLLTSRYRSFMAAVIYAWTGNQDEAVGLLEKLADVAPIVAPGTITRDPLIVTPLADNAKYQALAAKLEARIAENNTLLQ